MWPSSCSFRVSGEPLAPVYWGGVSYDLTVGAAFCHLCCSLLAKSTSWVLPALLGFTFCNTTAFCLFLRLLALTLTCIFFHSSFHFLTFYVISLLLCLLCSSSLPTLENQVFGGARFCFFWWGLIMCSATNGHLTLMSPRYSLLPRISVSSPCCPALSWTSPLQEL